MLAASGITPGVNARGLLRKLISSFPEFPSLKTYFQQRSLDPGRYSISRRDGVLQWTNPATLTMSRSGRSVELEISKSLGPAANPLRHDVVDTDSAVEYEATPPAPGWNSKVSDRLRKPDSWNLIQLPARWRYAGPHFLL